MNIANIQHIVISDGFINRIDDMLRKYPLWSCSGIQYDPIGSHVRVEVSLTKEDRILSLYYTVPCNDDSCDNIKMSIVDRDLIGGTRNVVEFGGSPELIYSSKIGFMLWLRVVLSSR